MSKVTTFSSSVQIFDCDSVQLSRSRVPTEWQTFTESGHFSLFVPKLCHDHIFFVWQDDASPHREFRWQCHGCVIEQKSDFCLQLSGLSLTSNLYETIEFQFPSFELIAACIDIILGCLPQTCDFRRQASHTSMMMLSQSESSAVCDNFVIASAFDDDDDDDDQEIELKQDSLQLPTPKLLPVTSLSSLVPSISSSSSTSTLISYQEHDKEDGWCCDQCSKQHDRDSSHICQQCGRLDRNFFRQKLEEISHFILCTGLNENEIFNDLESIFLQRDISHRSTHRLCIEPIVNLLKIFNFQFFNGYILQPGHLCRLEADQLLVLLYQHRYGRGFDHENFQTIEQFQQLYHTLPYYMQRIAMKSLQSYELHENFQHYVDKLIQSEKKKKNQKIIFKILCDAIKAILHDPINYNLRTIDLCFDQNRKYLFENHYVYDLMALLNFENTELSLHCAEPMAKSDLQFAIRILQKNF